jgi:hypothetical protein
MRITGAGFPPRVYAAGALAALIEAYGHPGARTEHPTLLADEDKISLNEWNGNTLTITVNGTDLLLSLSIPRRVEAAADGG